MNDAKPRRLGDLRVTANAAQLSIRDLRLRPLREMPAPTEPGEATAEESPLEAALLEYLETLDE